MRNFKRLICMLVAFLILFTGAGCSASSSSSAPIKPVETAKPTPTAVRTEAQPSKTIESSEKDDAYSYIKMNAVMYATAKVNVRAQPCKDGKKLGKLKKHESVTVTGQCEQTNWYRVEYDGGIGYVSDEYLSEKEPELAKETNKPEKTQEADETPKSTNTPKPTNTPEHTQTPKPTQSAKNENSSGSGSGVTVPEEDTSGSNLVWVPTNGGTKYHSYSGCSNMIDPIQVPKDTAERNGYTPCKRCH